MENKLAVVIPFFKATYFSETLTSLINQSDQRFNIYIGDDASLEDVSNLIKKCSTQIKIKYNRFEQNLGSTDLVAHWERCLDMINRGEKWVMILGDDDYLSQDTIKSFYEHLGEINDINSKVVKLNSIVVDETGIELSRKNIIPKINNGIDIMLDKFQKQNRSSLSEHIFHLQSLLNNGMMHYPLAWHTDDKMILDLSLHDPIFFIADAFVHVRVSQQSISGQQNNLMQKHIATQQFFNDFINYEGYLNKNQNKRLLDIVEWQENDKSINILGQNRIKFYYKYKGVKPLLSYLWKKL